MKKYSILISLLMMPFYMAHAVDEIRIGKDQKQLDRRLGVTKIVLGSALLLATFARGTPQKGYRGLKKDWFAFWHAKKIDGQYDNQSLCYSTCSTTIHTIATLIPLIPAYLIVDGLHDLRVFEALKKRINKKQIYLK
jgi:hypothetical protein